MQRIHTYISGIGTALILAATCAPLAASAQISYPKASPSSYYVLPEQMLSFSGSGFAPFETVRITGGGIDFTTYADAVGRVRFPYLLTVPFAWENSQQTFTIEGQESAYAIPMTIRVGTFYPQITPSSYFVAQGQSMFVSGRDFAPNEAVQVSIDGAAVGVVSATTKGTMLFGFFAPSSAGGFTITAQGLLSGESSSRTVTLQ